MDNWRTSAAGSIAGLAQVARAIWPQHSTIADSITALALALLGAVAHDARK